MKYKLNRTKLILVFIMMQSFGLLQAQTKKACDLTDVAAINKILNIELTYDPKSAANKSGKYECRYMDPNTPGKYIAVGLTEAKIEYGYDVLKNEFETNQKDVAAGKKATGKFIHFFPYPKGGPTAYYMTAPKDDFGAEAFILKFRKGNYVVSFSTEAIPTAKVIEKLDEVYKNLKI